MVCRPPQIGEVSLAAYDGEPRAGGGDQPASGWWQKPHTCVRHAGHASGQLAEDSRRSSGGIAAVSPSPDPTYRADKHDYRRISPRSATWCSAARLGCVIGARPQASGQRSTTLRRADTELTRRFPRGLWEAASSTGFGRDGSCRRMRLSDGGLDRSLRSAARWPSRGGVIMVGAFLVW